jgi:C-terminal processing protease CtpA/Prc
MFACCCAADPAESKAVEHVKTLNLNDESSLAPAVMAEIKATDETPQQSVAAEPTVPQQEPEAVPEPETAPSRSSEEPPQTFSITLVKDTTDAAMGWHLDLLDSEALFVCRLVPGSVTLLTKYNDGAAADKKIDAGDYITKVNGTTSAEAMSSELKSANKLEMVVQKPKLFSSTFKKGDGTMGLDLKYGPGGTSLLIEEVRDGVVKQQCPEVRCGDRIIKVNDQSGSPPALMDALREAASPEVTFSRSRR